MACPVPSQFLGDGREATFHVTRWPGNCSLFRPDPAAVDAFTGLGASHSTGNFYVVSTARVQTTRLDDVADLPRPDFIKQQYFRARGQGSGQLKPFEGYRCQVSGDRILFPQQVYHV